AQRRRYRRIAEPRLDAPVRSNPLLHAEPPVAGHQRLRRCDAKVVAIVLQAFAHLQNIDVAVGGEQADSRIPKTSMWPSVVSRPMRAPLRSSRALVATVVPWTMRSVLSSIAASVIP